MERNYNSEWFDANDQKSVAAVNRLINYLLTLDMEDDKYYSDIHIWNDSGGIIVDWDRVPYDHSFGGHFEYMDEGDTVYHEVKRDDGEYEDIPKTEYTSTLYELEQTAFLNKESKDGRD